MELTVLPGILRLSRHGHRRRSLKHGMSSNLHEDASGIGGKSGVNGLELHPPFPRARIPIAAVEILIRWGPSLLRGMRVVGTDLGGTNESATFPRASVNIVSFYSTKENLDQPLLRLFKKEVYATPSSKSKISTAS